VLEKPVVYAGGGSDNALLRISPQTILDVTQAEVLDLIAAPERANLEAGDQTNK
jgi:prolyl-tRNA editing enzyme YbaK/EbsC (Cys-tRNA(Pro) deacylase)